MNARRAPVRTELAAATAKAATHANVSPDTADTTVRPTLTIACPVSQSIITHLILFVCLDGTMDSPINVPTFPTELDLAL